jgi:iron complex outermembrane receptor protein
MLIPLACGVSALALAHAAAAQAPSAPATQAASPPSESSDTIAEVVVTAQRRTQNLRDVPIAITVVGGDTLKKGNFTTVSDIQYLAPSVQFTPTPAAPVFQVRGVGTQTFDYGIEQAVGLALDDVSQTLPRVNVLNTLADVERIEVLRGPQGTLFGKNTSAGLVSITTRKPQFDAYTNEAHLQYGSRNQLQAYDIINIPLSDTLAVRVRAAYQTQDPTLHNVGPGRIEDGVDYALNGKILWQATDKLSLYAIGDYQQSKGDPGEWSIRKFGAGTAAPGVGNNFVRNSNTALGVVAGPDNNDVALGAYDFRHAKNYGGQLTANYDLGGPTLTSVTAYRKLEQTINLEADQSPLTVLDVNTGPLRAHQFTQEVRIASPSGQRFDYVAGLYYYNQKTNSAQDQSGGLGYLPNGSTLRLSRVGGQSNFEVESKSYAAFGEGTLRATDKLRLILGGRYTKDEITSSLFVSRLDNVCETAVLVNPAYCHLTVPAAGTKPIGGKTSHGDWSGRAGVQYDLAPRTMAYVTVSRGYKGAGVSTVGNVAFDIDPETVLSYEAGLKADLLDRRLNLALAAFHSKYDDFQTQVFDPALGTAGAFRVGNAGGMRAQGVELEATLHAARGLTFNGGITYNDAKFTDYLAPCFAGQTAAQGCTLTGPRFDASGDKLPNAPKWSYSLNGNYERDLGPGLVGFLSANYAYRSAVLFGVGDDNTHQEGYGLLNLSAGIGGRDDRMKLSVFVHNAFDKRFAGVIFPSFFDVGGYSQVLPDAAFRRIGAAVDVRF